MLPQYPARSAARLLLPQWDSSAGDAPMSSIRSFSELLWSWRGHRNIGRIILGLGVPLPGRTGPSGPPGWRQTAVSAPVPFLYTISLKKTH